MTYPGLGGQQPAPQNAAPAGQLTPGVTPGVSGQIVAQRVIIIGTGGELLVYSPTAGAGNLIASIAGNAGTDPYGNGFVQGIAAYVTPVSDRIALQLGAEGGQAGFFVHDLTNVSFIDPIFGALNVGPSGCVAAITSGAATSLSTESQIEVEDSTFSGIGGGQVVITAGATVITGTLSVNGSTNTGSGNNGGVTSGPSGTVSAFPAAGPNHTHAEVHQHPL